MPEPRRIRIDIEAGGRKLIQVTDDGCGMVRDDAMLAFERHATSKLKYDEDLLTISTLGFRGEALPSIAAVSRVRLETRDPSEPSGTRRRNRRRQHPDRRRGRPAAGNLHHHSRSLLQYSGAPQVPQGGIHRTFAHRFAGDALRARPSRDALGAALRHQRHPRRSARCNSLRAHLPGLRQGDSRRTDSRWPRSSRSNVSACPSLRHGAASPTTSRTLRRDCVSHGFCSASRRCKSSIATPSSSLSTAG